MAQGSLVVHQAALCRGYGLSLNAMALRRNGINST